VAPHILVEKGESDPKNQGQYKGFGHSMASAKKETKKK